MTPIIDAYLGFFRAIKVAPTALEFMRKEERENYEEAVRYHLFRYFRNKLKVIALGDAKVGKSTLINYLLDCKILNANDMHGKAFQWKIKYIQEMKGQ